MTNQHLTRKQASEIRNRLGHGEGNRKVKIKRDGTVEYYGSTDDFNQQENFWHYAGHVNDVIRSIRKWGLETR